MTIFLKWKIKVTGLTQTWRKVARVVILRKPFGITVSENIRTRDCIQYSDHKRYTHRVTAKKSRVRCSFFLWRIRSICPLALDKFWVMVGIGWRGRPFQAIGNIFCNPGPAKVQLELMEGGFSSGFILR